MTKAGIAKAPDSPAEVKKADKLIKEAKAKQEKQVAKAVAADPKASPA